MTEKEIEQAMSEIMSGKRKPDLIVCSPAGWAMVDKSWKPRQGTPEKYPIVHHENKSE
jgi:hypothetical protein